MLRCYAVLCLVVDNLNILFKKIHFELTVLLQGLNRAFPVYELAPDHKYI